MARKQSLHENLNSQDKIKSGSDRAFGLVFSAVFIIVGLFPLLSLGSQQNAIRIWALVVAAVFLALAFVAPRLLAPLNKLWFKFGLLLHRVVSPLVMCFLFYLTITPIGLLMRALGKKPLDLDFEKKADSYWVHRMSPSPAPDSMKRQF